MLIRLIKDWKRFRAGRELDPPRPVAAILLKRGIARAADAKAAADGSTHPPPKPKTRTRKPKA